MQISILPPQAEEILGPLLASLPAASISPQPPTALLPHLTPILRQRVQLLSGNTSDPWLPLLCYDPAKASKLETIVKNERLEPHPVSGLVEVDWESEVEIQYKRVDEETLQSLITLRDLDLAVKLVYCLNDEIGGGSGWRIGEVNAVDATHSQWGYPSITAAESASQPARSFAPTNGRLPTPDVPAEERDDDDDDYWAQYDSTPARTPGPQESGPSQTEVRPGGGGGTDEDSYYAQYASVQPALDNHDPDEAHQNGDVESSLGRDDIATQLHNHLSSSSQPGQHEENGSNARSSTIPTAQDSVAQPRPSSSHGSSGSDTVARLEKAASASESADNGDKNKEASEVGIKQHIGTSIKSLWRLARVAGIDRAEFERVVKTELEVIGIMDDEAELSG